MKIFNTLTRQKEELTPIEPGRLRIYACGPTVYNYIHIGNARPLCVFDVLRRYLEWRGWKVDFAQNFTDIDDKLIRRAKEENTTVQALAEKYIAEFWVDAKGLNVREATVHPKATENIDEILSLIGQLVEAGYAYPAGGDVYFRAHAFAQRPRKGNLIGILPGARGAPAGISSARPWPDGIWERPSTSTAADRT